MKKRIILAISVLLVFGLAMVVFAYNKTNQSHHAAMTCCCKDGSCPMKSGDTAATGEQKTACCDMPDCCCKGGESCPMKKQGETSQTESVDTKNATVVSGSEHCDMACCKHKTQS
jgi:hypothetical protein